jgi:hypothetical protein
MKGVFNTKTWNSESTTVYKSDLETTTVKPQNTSGYFKCIACDLCDERTQIYRNIYNSSYSSILNIRIVMCFLPLLIFKN